MLQSQRRLQGQRQTWHMMRHQRHPLLQQHPILVSLVLLSSSIILSMVSFFADSLFPVFVLIGAPSTLVCLLLAFVLGTCGVLAALITMLEYVDCYGLQFALFPKLKEHSYD